MQSARTRTVSRALAGISAQIRQNPVPLEL
nr:MAG TPA: hypothetical protein [Caudoviricetes sp.]